MAIFFFLMKIFGNFFGKKCQVLGNFLTVKWQFSGGPDSNYYISVLFHDSSRCLQQHQGHRCEIKIATQVTNNGKHWLPASSRGQRLGPKAGLIGSKWDKSGTFQIRSQYILGRSKKSRIGPILG